VHEIIKGEIIFLQNQVNTLTVDNDIHGQRLDNYLFSRLKGVPKSHIYRIIRSGEVRINKSRAKAHSKLIGGDIVRLPPMRIAERTQINEKIHSRNFDILFEDDQLMVLNKPSGIAVHGGSGESFGIIEQLRVTRPDLPFLELAHRLDKETSGILLVAKKRSSLKNIQDQFRDRSTTKIYLALVLGAWELPNKVIDRALLKYLLADGQRRVSVVDPDVDGAMRSISTVKLLGQSPNTVSWASNDPNAGKKVSLLQVGLKTGRTHQIRVHLASEGYPIVGDDKYGNFEINKSAAKAKTAGMDRMFLHASYFSCLHPVTKKLLTFEASLPAELICFLRLVLPDIQTDTLFPNQKIS
jgi:23S rRNA pseudouridine955/2504/2580 synthase